MKKLILTVCLGAAWVSSAAIAASVSSMSLEVFKDGVERAWEVEVSCENVSDTRIMRRPVTLDKWCSTELPSLCNVNKFSLSRQLCNDNFVGQLVKYRDGDLTTKSEVAAAPLVEATKAPTELAAATEISAEKVKVVEVSSQKISLVTEPVIKTLPTPNRSQTVAMMGRDALLKEQVQIEEQRIQIEQKRLELRRRELTLQKQQLGTS